MLQLDLILPIRVLHDSININIDAVLQVSVKGKSYCVSYRFLFRFCNCFLRLRMSQTTGVPVFSWMVRCFVERAIIDRSTMTEVIAADVTEPA